MRRRQEDPNKPQLLILPTVHTTQVATLWDSPGCAAPQLLGPQIWDAAVNQRKEMVVLAPPPILQNLATRAATRPAPFTKRVTRPD